MNGGHDDFDLIVIGAGCAGMSAALFGAIAGRHVLLLERSAWVGGTSALSAGAVWIPNTAFAADAGDSVQNARRYLDAAIGERSPSALRERFLALGPEAVRCLEAHSDVRLRAFAYHPDYLSDLPGSTRHGRVLECLPFDGRRLGAAFALVRPPIPEFTVLGGMMVDRIDIGHLLRLARSARSFAHGARLLLRYARDRLTHPRGTRLVMGNALVGRLLASLLARNVPILTGARTDSLLARDGRITGVTVTHDGATREFTARDGVILAGGGFGDDAALRAQLIPTVVRYSPRAGTSTGELQRLAMASGARLGTRSGSAACWAPVSVRHRRDGTAAVFPHFVFDRAKPGTVVVDATGRRFVDESTSYHLFGERMLAHAAERGGEAVAFLIADRRALVAYGLGMIRPGGRGLQRFVRDGYLVAASTVPALAHALAIDATTLESTVSRLNGFAATGVDADFGRGTNAYQRNLGDPAFAPNPTLGPIRDAPFYAIRLYPGDIAASVGLVTDADARVLRGDAPIPGLFAIGNEMQSMMGDAYPGPGINLGPAIVFAYAAVQAATTPGKETP